MKAINPIIYADYPDPDVTRAGDCYYMISTAMHMFPGGQILRSYDLTHWEHCAYVYDILGETARQRMDEGHIYGKGMWAASLKYARGCFHAVFTSNDTGHSYYYTAEKAEGPWTRQPMNGFWYDPGLLFDDDGKVYVAHGNRTVRITELAADLSEKRAGGLDRVVLVDDNPRLGWEGSHFIKHDGWYYLFNIHWRPDHMRAMGCFRSRTLDGEFEGGEFMELDLDGRHAGVAQGGPVQLHDGSWALFLFQDHGAVGRIPVVVPFRWVDGWPVVDEVPKHLELPSSRPAYEYAPLYTSDDLRDGWSVLWQWNHEPHPELIECDETGLHITTDRLASNCTEAINTLTQRCFGPRMSAEVVVDGSDLKPGDHAGICALMGCFAQLAVTRREEGLYLVLTRKDAASGEIVTEEERPFGATSRLQAEFDFTTDTVQFLTLDADAGWVKIGQPHQLVYRLDHFMGCRVGLFMYSTKETGGSARFTGFRYQVEEEEV
ncbi:MAG: family 43 glycosylhydrolase [Clostridia bacterium]|nr:family 43 glycosylhydrolase [Clostridia bacterium]